jgi:hypothetical protein
MPNFCPSAKSAACIECHHDMCMVDEITDGSSNSTIPIVNENPVRLQAEISCLEL